MVVSGLSFGCICGLKSAHCWWTKGAHSLTTCMRMSSKKDCLKSRGVVGLSSVSAEEGLHLLWLWAEQALWISLSFGYSAQWWLSQHCWCTCSHCDGWKKPTNNLSEDGTIFFLSYKWWSSSAVQEERAGRCMAPGFARSCFGSGCEQGAGGNQQHPSTCSVMALRQRQLAQGRHDSKNAPWRLLLPMWCQVYAYGLYFLSTGACLQVAKWTLALKSEEVWDDRADPQFTSPVLHNYRFHLQLGVRKQKSAQVHEKPRNSGLLHMRTSLCLSCCRLGPCLAHWPKKNVWIHWGFL